MRGRLRYRGQAIGVPLLRAFLASALCALAAIPSFAQVVAPDYSTLRAQSAGLSKGDRAKAKQLFATAFTLWQSGNFAAAEVGFKQGLDIDPANAVANYYYGDCLARRKDKTDAKDYLQRAATFGGGTAEGMEAQAEIAQLSVAPTNVSDMTPDEVRAAYVGQWTIRIVDHSAVATIADQNGTLTISGTVPGWGLSEDIHLKSIDVTGDHVVITAQYDNQLPGRLVTPIHMEGQYGGGFGETYSWSADKRQ